MADSVFGALISAGANLLGGMFNRQSAQELNQTNIMEQEKFAQNSIQWRVNDAKAAGINPLAALGAQTSSFSNVVGDTSMGSGVAAAGQDLGRAANAMADAETKKAQLENKLLEIQVASAERDFVATSAAASSANRHFASPGSPPGGLVSVPLPRSAPHSANTLPLMQDYRTRDGERITLPSAEASQALQNLASTPGGVAVAAALTREYGRNWVDAAGRSGAANTSMRSLPGRDEWFDRYPAIP